MKKREISIYRYKTNTRVSIPAKAVSDVGITKAMFIEWEEQKQNLVGTLCQVAKPPLTTSIVETGRKRQLTVEILGFYVKKCKVIATNKGGPKIRWEWDSKILRGYIPIKTE